MTQLINPPQKQSHRTPVLDETDVSRMAPESAVAALIDQAIYLSASDLFFTADESAVNVSVRHLGIVRPLASMPTETGRRALAHIKAVSRMDISERRRPTDGRWIYRNADTGAAIDLRINSLPTLHGEDLAVRLLPRDSQLHSLENLGMSAEQTGKYLEMISSPAGLILITGPTGSGKTATLYSTLSRLNDGRRKINTIEDPIEYTIDGLRQSQVNPAIELGFAEMLRGVLRQNPDVIMVGEIRDEETARTTIHAANSGMLVLATLHASSAAGAAQTLRSFGVNPHFLAQALRGVVAQRLLRTLCPDCKQPLDLADAPHTFDAVRPWLGEAEGRTLWMPRGCPSCNGTGYAARTGVFEVMPVNRTIRGLIDTGAPTAQLRDAAIAQKMLQFREAALLKVARGITSTEEVFRVIPAEELLDQD